MYWGSLKGLNLKPELLVAHYCGNNHIIPRGNDTIEADDRVIIITKIYAEGSRRYIAERIDTYMNTRKIISSLGKVLKVEALLMHCDVGGIILSRIVMDNICDDYSDNVTSRSCR